MTLAPVRLSEAKDSLAKASTPEPFSRSRTSNWVARRGGLPPYVQHIAHDIMEKRGMPESRAISIAIGVVKNPPASWDANAKAAAAKAAAEWEAKKGSAGGKGGKLHASEEPVAPSLADRVALRRAARARLAAIEEAFGAQMMLALLEADTGSASFSPQLKRTASAHPEGERFEVHHEGQQVGSIASRRGYAPGGNRPMRWNAKAVNGRMVGETEDSKQAALGALRKHLEEGPARVSKHPSGKFLVAEPEAFNGTVRHSEFPSESAARYAAGLPEKETSLEKASKVQALGEMASFDALTLALLGEEDSQLAEAGFSGVFDEHRHPRGPHGKFAISSIKPGHVIQFTHKSPRGFLRGRVTGKGAGHVTVKLSEPGTNQNEMRVSHDRITHALVPGAGSGRPGTPQADRFVPVAQPGSAARTRAEIIAKAPGAEREAQNYRSALKGGSASKYSISPGGRPNRREHHDNDPKERGVVGRRMIGVSAEGDGHVAAAYYHANGALKNLGDSFASHEAAHKAIVKAHERYKRKAGKLSERAGFASVFDSAKHPRGAHGRFSLGDRVNYQHSMFGRVPATVTKVTSRHVVVKSQDPRVASARSLTHKQADASLSRTRGADASPKVGKGGARLHDANGLLRARFASSNERVKVHAAVHILHKTRAMNTDEAAHAIESGKVLDTFAQHAPNGRIHPEREKLHYKIISHFLGDTRPQEKPQAMFTAGGPASGKTALLDMPGAPKDHVMVNPDLIREMLPEYDELKAKRPDIASSGTHSEASHLAGVIMQAAIASKRNFIVDGVGDSSPGKFAKKIQRAQAAGHQVQVRYAHTPVPEAERRERKRFEKTGRRVPTPVLRAKHAEVSQRYGEVAKLKGVSVHVFDTGGKQGEPLPLISTVGPDGKMKVHNEKLHNEFLAKGNG